MLRQSRLLIPCFAAVLLAGIASSPAYPQTKPVVVSTDPVNGATNVSRSLVWISVTFSKSMQWACGSTSTNWGGTGECIWSADMKTLRMSRRDPSALLPALAQVIIAFNPPPVAIYKDTEGNVLDLYTLRFTLEGGSIEAGTLTQIPANPQNGFSWPYYLYRPSVLTNPPILMVEPNNTGTTSDDNSYHDAMAKDLITGKMPWADELGVFYLVPTFPRPAANSLVYTQALDRNTLQTNLPGLVRIDLQLIAMIDDARARLAERGINVDPKVWMVGYSASGSFTSRFTILHPDRIKAASIGSPGSYPIVPVPAWKGKDLRYPVGVADLEALVGHEFDVVTFRSVPLQIYIGDLDFEDALDFPDSSQAEDAATIKQVFGGPPPFLRWPPVEAAYNSIQSSCQFVVFPGMGHVWPDWAYIRDFFNRNRSEPFPPPLPKPPIQNLYFPHVACFGPWETEIALTNTSEIAVHGELRAFKAEGGSPIQSMSVSIPPMGRKEINVGKFFQNPAAIGYVVFNSDSGFVAGYTRFSQPGNRVSLAATGGIQWGWFPKIESNGWTGLAFVNIDTNPAAVTLTATDENGNKVGEERLTVNAGVKTLGLVQQLFHTDISNARYFSFSSDKKILAFSVSGSADGLMLDGLAAEAEYIRQ